MVRDQVVQAGDHGGAALGDDALGVDRLAGLAHDERHHRRDGKVGGEGAARALGAAARVGEHVGDGAAAG